jgi:hypothetical protein
VGAGCAKIITIFGKTEAKSSGPRVKRTKGIESAREIRRFARAISSHRRAAGAAFRQKADK